MKALTVCQPYAAMIVDGIKRVENRTWPTKHRGLIYIHAGKSRRWIITAPNWPMPPLREFGAVLGIADLVDCLEYTRIRAGEYVEKYPWLLEHEHTSGPWCWILARPEHIGPWPWRGAQGLFNIDGKELAAIATRTIKGDTA